MFIHQKDDNIPQDKLYFVLDTLATLQKKDKEENVLNLDYAKMLLKRREILLNKLIAWKHYGAGANARKFFVSNRRPDKRGCLQSCRKKE